MCWASNGSVLNCCKDWRMTRAQLDKKPGDVAAMFDSLAGRYDLMNDVLSAGQDRRWRRAVARAVGAAPGERVLDLAAGTGTSSRAFAAAGAQCVACDFSLGMLSVGKQGADHHGADHHRADHDEAGAGRPAGMVSFVAGDALAIPFREQAFDAVTISFGLRNVVDPDAALAEMLRVTRPGGRLVICEFSHLPRRSLDAVYSRYLAAALPFVAGRLSGNAEAYSYLAESIADWPAQRELARRIAAAGWRSVRWQNLSMGVVAVHVAQRPRGGGRPGPV
jgi:demethylmenaquinone methyltransferase/2-methoxy-6-polyprenyl-1,4-benzoquinol methylase